MTVEEPQLRFKIPRLPPLALWQRRVRIAAVVLASLGVSVATLVVAAYLAYAPTVPMLNSLDDYLPKVGTSIYSGDNQLIGEFSEERRVLVPLNKIPPLLLKAFVAAEDKRFYSHGGIDLIGNLQALADKVRSPGKKLRGASTITQQVARSLLATHETYEAATERSLVRKIREAILARRLEARLSKDDILYLYLNQIFLGYKAYGVQAAAEHYFRKNVGDLTLAEMATLAGLPQRPSDYSPISRPDAALMRRKYVLRRMLEEGYITRTQAENAEVEQLTVYPREELYLTIAPYYTEQVRREIIDRYGERAVLADGLQVYTALNIEYDILAQDAISDGLHALDKRQGFRGPLAQLKTPALRTLFLQKYREELGLSAGEELRPDADRLYLGVVTGYDEKGEVAKIDVAGHPGLVPIAGMRWARTPDPTERVDMHYVTDVRRVLRPGDVISVKKTDRNELARDYYGWEAIQTVPKEGDIFKLAQEPIAQGSLLSVDPRSGYVVAQEGGYNFEDSSYNRAIQACREPGSAFKPIVYTAAIDKLDYTASTQIDDKPLVYDNPDDAMRWKPDNAGQKFRGMLPLRECLIWSINTPAIRIAEAVGIEDLIKNARRLGITTDLKRELGIAIGSSCTTMWDLIKVYVTLNQMGVRRDMYFIRRVVDRFGNVIEDHTVPWDPTLTLTQQLDSAYRRLLTPENQVLDSQTAFLMVSLMKEGVEYGTGQLASHTGHIVAGKTGTTNDSFDAWFMGFTTKLVTGVWVGHDKKERPLGVNEQGGITAAPIWAKYTSRALMDYSVNPPKLKDQGDFEPPPGIVRVAIDPETGYLARPNKTRTVYEYYRAGSEPTEYAPDKAVFHPKQMDVYGADAPL
jgi:penicillin-binding protein 1A